MDDLIRRQDAIEYFMTNTNWHDEEGYPIDDAEDKRALLTDYFNGVPSAQQWIPCSERLPDEPKPNKELEGKPLDIYLVCKSGNIPFRAFWNGKFFADGWTTLDVDAWMPLPSTFKAESEVE